MCSILSVVFNKNGSQSIPGCTATSTDKIEIVITARITNTEINKYITANATWTISGLSDGSAWAIPQYITSVDTYNFIILVPVSSGRTYTISSVFVYNNTDNTMICNTSSSQICNTLTITSTLKWKCSGSPNYTCSQASDGTYDTEAECVDACKSCELPVCTITMV